MNRSLSTFIDLCRVAAAGVVVFGHLDALGFVPVDLHGRPNRAGHDAVIVFFVLSGLVIAHAAATTQRSARAYAVARASRLYSVAVPAVLIGYGLDRIGMQMDAAAYLSWQYARWPLHMAFQWLFLGEAWTHSSVVPFSNVPYWSLSYEAWYYALFGVAVFARGAPRQLLVVAVLAAMGPKPWLLLPAWLGGVWLHRLIARPAASLAPSVRRPARAATAGLPPMPDVSAMPGMIGATGGRRAAWIVATAAGAAGYALLVATGAQAALEAHSQRLLAALHAHAGLGIAANLGYSRFFLADWATAALFMLVLLGVARLAPPAPAWLARAASAAAGMSFTLYLLHYPLLRLLRATGAFAPGWWSTAAAALVVLGATALAAALFERRRAPWRRLFGAAWDLLTRRPAR